MNPGSDGSSIITSKASVACSNYTIGWICALPTEVAAAEAMLDQAHRHPLKHKQDDKTYIDGQIAQHKIGMACLPLGRVGITSAAMVAEHLRLTFTTLQLSLLTGIGGSIQSKRLMCA